MLADAELAGVTLCDQRFTVTSQWLAHARGTGRATEWSAPALTQDEPMSA